MKYCTCKIVEWLINHDAIKSEDKELYEYALYSLWLLATPLFLAIIIGGCLGGVKEGIIIVIPFMLIRKFSGGYHAKHLWICLIGSTILLSLRRWTKGYTIKQPNMDCQPTEITALMRHRAVFS